MTRAETTVSADAAGRTLASIVRDATGGLPWSKVRKLIESGKVRVGEEVQRDSAVRLRAGARVTIDSGARAAPVNDEPDEDVQVLHVDPAVVVVNKPAGLLTVPWEDERDTLVHRAHSAVRRRAGNRHLPPLRVVQRLDKDTSGVLVFARTRRAERSLSDQLRKHTVERQYLALVEGAPAEATHDTWLMPDRGDGRRGSARMRPGANPPAGAKRSITHVQPLERFAVEGGVASLVACTLDTGRQHQIRIHLAEAGHPLLGEKVYGERGRTPPVAAPRPMLHAERLGFVHPADDEMVRFFADPPADFEALLQALRAAARP